MTDRADDGLFSITDSRRDKMVSTQNPMQESLSDRKSHFYMT